MANCQLRSIIVLTNIHAIDQKGEKLRRQWGGFEIKTTDYEENCQ
jgi:hypothetical protein